MHFLAMSCDGQRMIGMDKLSGSVFRVSINLLLFSLTSTIIIIVAQQNLYCVCKSMTKTSIKSGPPLV